MRFLVTAPAPLGHVLASIGLSQDTGLSTEPRITIGNFLGIETDASRVVAVITTSMAVTKPLASKAGGGAGWPRPIPWAKCAFDANGALVCQRGITRYPVLGEPLLAAATRTVHAASSLRTRLLAQRPTMPRPSSPPRTRWLANVNPTGARPSGVL